MLLNLLLRYLPPFFFVFVFFTSFSQKAERAHVEAADHFDRESRASKAERERLLAAAAAESDVLRANAKHEVETALAMYKQNAVNHDSDLTLVRQRRTHTHKILMHSLRTCTLHLKRIL